jgi:hypothetical protein
VPPAPRTPASAAGIVYIGIVASTIIVSVGAAVVSASLHTTNTSFGALDGLALLAGLGGLGAVLRLRGALPESTGGDAWWRANAGACLVLWALLELVALIGSTLLFITGHVVVFAVLVLAAMGGLVTLSPGRLAPP